jgi:protein-S-isoprenylcysteine O-methyltransferase Ste14
VQTTGGDDIWVRAGGWLFRKRTSLPVPLALILLLVPPQTTSNRVFWIGAGLVAAGETLRVWGVHHIGAVSRTRSDRLGPLIDSGPFAFVRNPLYIGNIALWIGFALSARLPVLAPVIAAALALEYHAIIRWEEQLLASRVGAAYDAYAMRVPRWVPRLGASGLTNARANFSWATTLFSERGTLIAIAAGYLLLWLKTRVM